MNILGIIAEFNPLHTGHEYLIQKLRQETETDYCVVAMSGDYVQRGEPAFFSKSLRTRAALLSGADLVLELPLSVSTGSAEYFAQGAISLLENLGCVTHLGFGSESGDIRSFLLAGKLLVEESESYRTLLQEFLKKGMNFPKARCEALSTFLTENAAQNNIFIDDNFSFSENLFNNQPTLSKNISRNQSISSKDISDILSLLKSPNNILGTEYCKALYQQRSFITPVTIQRIGDGYHEDITNEQHFLLYRKLQSNKTLPENASSADIFSQRNYTLNTKYASASGLRKKFLSCAISKKDSFISGKDSTVSRKDYTVSEKNKVFSQEIEMLLQNYVPKACHPLYLEALQNGQYMTFDDFFLPLYYTIQYSNPETLCHYQDVTPAFSKRLYSLFRQASSASELCVLLKSKNLTASRINRSLLHILLKLTKDNVIVEKEQGFALYARILGFRREAQPLLSLIKEKTSIPLISKLADASKYLSPLALSRLEQTIKASELYRAALPGNQSGSEYEEKIIIL